MKLFYKIIVLIILCPGLLFVPSWAAEYIAQDVQAETTVSDVPAEEQPAADGRKYALSAPVLTSVTNVSGGVRLTWEPVEGAAQYHVLRRAAGASRWSKVTDTANTSVTNRKNVVSGVTYTYTVRCMDADGNIISAYDPDGLTVTFLAAPALTGAFSGSGHVTVTWNPVPDAEGYYVYRKAASGAWKRIASIPDGGIGVCTDTSSMADAEGVYTVRAVAGGVQSGINTAGVTPVPADTTGRVLTNTDTAQKTNQIVLVVDHALSLWQRASDGTWRQDMDVYCGYGRNGLRGASARVEGDGTTPIGAFPLLFAFGTGADPGTEMTYRQITPYSYWSAANDATYNTWVESAVRIPGEHLADYYQYKYAFAIGFNIDPAVYGRGTAIFLHCKSTDHWYTAGCVSLTETDILTLFYELENGAYIIIVPNADALALY